MKSLSFTKFLGLLVSLNTSTFAIAQSDALQAYDIQLKGAYSTRTFARVPGSGVAVQTALPPEIPGKLISESKTGDTNELIVLLNYDNHDRLTAIAPGHSKTDSAALTERVFLDAINSKSGNAVIAFGNPVNGRNLINVDRMSDAERAKQVKIQVDDVKKGVKPNPREQMERYMVLRYDSPEQARAQLNLLQKDPAVAYATMNSTVVASYTPNDPYFSNNGNRAQYQWGLFHMNFPGAWDTTRGQAYVGVLDPGWPGSFDSSGTPASFVVHPDLLGNFRQHMTIGSPAVTVKQNYAGGPYVSDSANISANHTVHVSGIIAATLNNRSTSIAGNGAPGSASNGAVAGACPECNFVPYPVGVSNQTSPWQLSTVAEQLVAAVDSGMQIINWSGGIRSQNTCVNTWLSQDVICTALSFATTRGVLVVISSGNNNNDSTGGVPLNNGPQFPGNLHDGSTEAFSVLPVGGVTWTGLRWVNPLRPGSNESGANFASTYGVSAPADSVISTFNMGATYYDDIHCSDNASDSSAPRYTNGVGDGVSTCTGTSMAAPHISALAGLLRSVNPRASASAVRTMLRESGNLFAGPGAGPTAALGYGVPNAIAAVNKALASNPTRLTPLFAYYSADRADSFYTTVPQMARAAAEGKLLPKNPSAYLQNYTAAYGVDVSGYLLPPESPVVVGADTSRQVKAQVWLFTTDLNPKSTTTRLTPVVRMSWKCGDSTPYPPTLCGSKPSHMDTVLVSNDEVAYFKYLGYKVDGTEGFVYPKSLPRPTGAVKLMRKYNAALDDHAIFPESTGASMASQGWIYDTNANDWLGYVYPNTGTIPVIQ